MSLKFSTEQQHRYLTVSRMVFIMDIRYVILGTEIPDHHSR